MPISSSHPTLLAVVLALLNHLYFHRFTPTKANKPILLLTIQPLLLFLATPSSSSLSGISVVFLSTLCISIALYRISPWHPLAHIPGPFLPRITKLWGAWTVASGRAHRVNKALHDKYGPFVRTGPNEISVIHVDAVKAVLGTGGFPKGAFYEGRKDPSLQSGNLLVLLGDAHANRRRIWNRGMSTESLDEYETTILGKRIVQLMDRLDGLRPGPVNMAEWINYFTFDVMGDMAFGGGFEMLRDGGDKEGLWTLIEASIKTSAVISQTPWAISVVHLIPGATRSLKTIRKFGAICAANRVKAGSKVKDLWYHLMDEAEMEKEKPAFSEVVADGTLSILAGSDTTSSALSSFVWLLLSNPRIYQRVQAEVDTIYPDEESTLDSSRHGELKLLTACINETLRLQPSLRTNGPRQVPPGEGRVVAGRFIPEHTQIYVPPYSLHRNAEYFSFPDTFDPDRWLRDRVGESDNTTAFIPFSYGAANCVGKALAWREMLMVASTLVKRFEMRFAEGFESTHWDENLHDYMVTSVDAPLLVEISRRV
ncbi:cytochrome P450 [Roridomyces roridus]|uniref:Cytochrome P450 n=1 Tax=Roridomyces roridus TaxID=1738132 RepID=A0AAD7FN22_9AGAR|nr:cytochrome P450 [Roridomyces roridus]